MKLNVGFDTPRGFSEVSTDISYLNILTQLKRDLDSDTCMPTADHDKADKLVKELFDILWKYSY